MTALRQSPRSAKNRRVALAFDRSGGHETRLFSPEECDAAVKWAEAARFEWKKLLRGRVPDSPWRTRIRSGHDKKDGAGARDAEIAWLPAKLREIGLSLNRQIWRFDITDWSDVLIIRYGVGHRLPKHSDLNEEVSDYKITMLLQLSPGGAYEGGVLEFGTPPAVASREQGSLLAFPAWMPHEVTAITSGIRYVAAVRALGPSFR